LDLKIHPNTAHKVVQHLIQERWLMAQPGVGTWWLRRRRRAQAIASACSKMKWKNSWWKRCASGASLNEVQQAVEDTWTDLRGLKARIQRVASMIVETHHVAKRFGRFEAIEDLSLSVPEGSVFALIGPQRYRQDHDHPHADEHPEPRPRRHHRARHAVAELGRRISSASATSRKARSCPTA
jgi:hypothetical protein